MNDFVEQCRHEWKRLRVPDPIANEMAADLAADLQEGAADGLSAEEVLGSDAFDPPAFAAAWAAERGLIPALPEREPRPYAPRTVIGLAVASGIVFILAAITLLNSPGQTATVEPTAFTPRFGATNTTADTLAWILLLLSIAGGIVAFWLWSSGRRPRATTNTRR